MRTIAWRDGHIEIIEQTLLPHELRVIEIDTVDALVDAIVRLAVRGAPALGIAGALGVALAARLARRDGWPERTLAAEIERIRNARPTAVNLSWGVDQVLPSLPLGAEAVTDAALALLGKEVAAERAIGERGADFLQKAVGDGRDGKADAGRLRLHTHCNTGALACVEWGTALGVVRSLHARGQALSVVVDETRPLLQGARLTAWELGQLGIDHQVVCDGAGPAVIGRGLVDAVVVGADRIAANGDVANKVGTYGLALAAGRAGIPFVVAAPESTIDLGTSSGEGIKVELRPQHEVTTWQGTPLVPDGTSALNPAFDVTPADLVTAIVTERRLLRPQRGETPASTT